MLLPNSEDSAIYQNLYLFPPSFQKTRGTHAVGSDRELCSLNKEFFVFKSLLFRVDLHL
jgi:hypothetical protein